MLGLDDLVAQQIAERVVLVREAVRRIVQVVLARTLDAQLGFLVHVAFRRHALIVHTLLHFVVL